VPYTLAFDDGPMQKDHYGPLEIWDLTLDVIFCLDIAISFCTCYFENGLYVSNLGKIFTNYLRTWFFLDLVGSVPFDKIIVAVSSSQSTSGSSLRALRFIRLLKIVRAIRFVKKLSQVEENDTSGYFRNVINIF
ncbi:hypothetical protein GUITHDRAFT_54524, partial [Guillardia theta CCMP2712]